jgi:erythritol transport system permease protein
LIFRRRRGGDLRHGGGALLTNGLPLWNGDIIFFNVPEVILCVAIFGVLVGLVNGAVITRFGVAPFICTLGMMYVARGSALLFNDGSTYPNLNGMEALGNTGFSTLGSGTCWASICRSG